MSRVSLAMSFDPHKSLSDHLDLVELILDELIVR